MRHSLLPLVIVALTCAACGHGEVMARPRTHFGLTPEQLAAALGAPATTREMEMTFHSKDESRAYKSTWVTYSRRSPDGERWCATTYETDIDGIISDFHFSGNACLVGDTLATY